MPIGLVGLALAVGAAWLAGQQGDGQDVWRELDDAKVLVTVRALTVLPDLNSPTDAQTDPQGQLWVVERDGNRVIKRLADGSWQTVAGTGQPGRTGDGAMAIALDGTLYI